MKKQPVRPAATVILVRPALPQYEILMLKRTTSAAFAGGMYVFPGGRVDESDYLTNYDKHMVPLTTDQIYQKEAHGDDWLGCWVAAIRETFEESGLLLAYDEQGQEINNQHQRVSDYRQQLRDNDLQIDTICAQEGWLLATDQIHFYNRWVTPPGRPRRFDTRFFIGAAPDRQQELHDGEETTDSIWISPAEALIQNKQGDFAMMAVTVKQLQDMDQYTDSASLLRMAKSSRDFPHYRPDGSAR